MADIRNEEELDRAISEDGSFGSFADPVQLKDLNGGSVDMQLVKEEDLDDPDSLDDNPPKARRERRAMTGEGDGGDSETEKPLRKSKRERRIEDEAVRNITHGYGRLSPLSDSDEVNTTSPEPRSHKKRPGSFSLEGISPRYLDVYAKRKQLGVVWGDKQAKLQYRVGGRSDGSEDALVFQSEKLKTGENKKGSLEVNVWQLNQAFGDQEIRNFSFPKNGLDTEAVLIPLQKIRIDDVTYQGQSFDVDRTQLVKESRHPKNKASTRKDRYVKKESREKDIHTIKISLKEENVEKSAEAIKIKEFWDTLSKNDNSIESLAFEAEDQGIEWVSLHLKKAEGEEKGKVIRISAYAFSTYFEGVSLNSDRSGFEFKSSQVEGKGAYVHPGTSEEILKKIAKRFRFGSEAKLADSVRVFVQKEERAKQEPEHDGAKPVQKLPKELSESSEEPKGFSLTINQQQVERVVAQEELPNLNKFREVWASGKATKLEVDSESGRIGDIKLFYIDEGSGMEKYVALKRGIFSAVYDGVEPYKASNDSEPEGLTFNSAIGKTVNIIPTTNPDFAKKFFMELSVDGSNLPQGVDFELVKSSKPQPITT